jgi:hypothetical protein
MWRGSEKIRLAAAHKGERAFGELEELMRKMAVAADNKALLIFSGCDVDHQLELSRLLEAGFSLAGAALHAAMRA